MKVLSLVNQKLYLFPPVQDLFNVLHHDTFHFRHLSFHLSKLTHLLRVINTILHMFLQFWPATIKHQITNFPSTTNHQPHTKHKTHYPNSLFKLLGAAVDAFPPPYFATKSSFTRSRKATGTCLPTVSSATTQYV
uniref:Uncharacterized protein n=1 Tax=Medicago truncatula TaxID=3880 RepID=B7FKT8_MEDTR|nr:unknown [Medicago truncatula]AFK33807.1 unknown [Medicago truncatula]